MILDLGGEPVTAISASSAAPFWANPVRRSVTTIAPVELLDVPGDDTAVIRATIYLAAGDPLSREDRVELRGRVYAVLGEPKDFGDFVEVELITAARAAVVDLLRPAMTDYNPSAEVTTVADSAPYATGVAAGIRPQVGRGDSDVEAGEESIEQQPYVVTLGPDLTPTEGDFVEVTACREDPSLVGRTLRVHHVLRGTERYDRQLLCTLLDVP